MTPAMRRTALLALDKKLRDLRPLASFERPRRGWIRAVKESLGMSTTQLAKRMRVTQPRVTDLESREVTGRVTIESMQRAAEALGCQFVWAMVPRDAVSLEAMRQQRAHKIAEKQIDRVDHTMALENQTSDLGTRQERVAQLTADLLSNDRSLWADNEP